MGVGGLGDLACRRETAVARSRDPVGVPDVRSGGGPGANRNGVEARSAGVEVGVNLGLAWPSLRSPFFFVVSYEQR